MRRLSLSILVLLGGFGVPCQAASLTGATINASGDLAFRWDTFPNFVVMLGVKEDGVFLNPNDQQLDYDLTSPGIYDFEIRLNKGSGRNMSAYDFALFFDGGSSPAITATADVDSKGGTPEFSGSLSYLDVTLRSLRLSTFGDKDEVDEFSADPDDNIDYAGSFQLTVVPEPSTPVLLSIGAVVLLACARRRTRRPGEQVN